MRKLLGLLLALALAVPVWPQAQPKPARSPTPQATAPATTPGPCAADYYRNSDGVCVHRPLRRKARLFRRALRLNAGTGAIRSASTEGERVRIMAGSQNGCEFHAQ
jgi:hypothetical protein